jgi:hypothetical protein
MEACAVNNTPERPTTACLTCPPPREQRNWRPADPGYRTCASCLARIRDTLKDIVRRYLLLTPRPGASGDHGRGAPGFGSRSPGSEHVIAMRDRRSSPVARTWLGADGRLHQESERPPLSVHGVLDTIAWDIAEARQQHGPDERSDVPQLARYIDVNLDWATRQPGIAELDQQLRHLAAQLKPVTGDPGRRHIGTCPVVIDEGQHTRECGARLYAPLRGDEIECGSCGERWPREKWLRLGDLLEAS